MSDHRLNGRAPLEELPQPWGEMVLPRAVNSDRLGMMALLKDREALATALYHGIRIAVGTHDQEKREALVNMVMNCSLRNYPEEDLRLMFLHSLDTMTAWHLRLLKFAGDPKSHCEERGITYPNYPAMQGEIAVEKIFSELKDHRAFCEQIVKDLGNRGLVEARFVAWSLSTVHLPLNQWTTDLGNQFLSFISSPTSILEREAERE